MPSSPREGWAGPALLTGAVLALIAILAFSGRLLGQGPPPQSAPVPIAVAFPTAFVGGVLALLSPCSGAIVPAFFAYSFRTPGRLLRQTYVFFLGLALVFVPLGFASSLIALVFIDHANTLYAIGGVLLLALGVATLLDVDVFERIAAPLTRVADSGQRAMGKAGSETARVFLYGVVFGFATSSCTAPLIGAMATLAVGTGLQSMQAMLLFLTFALGIAAPLFVLAAFFERYRVAERKWLRQTAYSVRGREVSLQKAVTGGVLALLGVLFLAFRGTLALTATYDRFGATEAYARWTQAVGDAFAALPPWIAWAIGLAIVLGGGWLLARLARPRDAS